MRSLRILFFGLSVLAGALPAGCRGLQKKITPDEFFESLFLGGVDKGKIYIELDLKPELFSKTKTREDRWAVWDVFFKKAIWGHPSSPGSQIYEIAPYWGEYAFEKEKIDQAYIAKSVNLQIGDRIHFRTAYGIGVARVVEYAIHYGGPAVEGYILLAVAKPEIGSDVKDTRLLVASRAPFDCQTPCSNHRTFPTAEVAVRVKEALIRSAKKPANNKISVFTVLQGSFTKRGMTQYVAYVQFDDYMGNDYWRTALIDSDFSIITILGENEYGHILPLSVGDINADGLDEIWVDLVGYEGSHAGVFYLESDGRSPRFKAITTAYFGL